MKATLFDIFSQRFDDAVAQRNQTDITRYFKLFPLIHCQTEGLDKYSRFVCNIVKARCAEELKTGFSNTFYRVERIAFNSFFFLNRGSSHLFCRYINSIVRKYSSHH